MNKNLFWLIALLFSLSFGFVSCAEDTAVEDPYANWEDRNIRYLDSIVDVARANVEGNWVIYRNYKVQNGNSVPGLGGDFAVDNPYETPPSAVDSVYMKILEPGNPNGLSPLFTDSVRVYYQGRLINGEIFDGYTGELNEEVNEPSTFALQSTYPQVGDGLILGWITALQQMKEGQKVELYIPSALGYGTENQSAIPANSTLIFEMKLEKVIHPDGIENYSLKVN